MHFEHQAKLEYQTKLDRMYRSKNKCWNKEYASECELKKKVWVTHQINYTNTSV